MTKKSKKRTTGRHEMTPKETKRITGGAAGATPFPGGTRKKPGPGGATGYGVAGEWGT